MIGELLVNFLQISNLFLKLYYLSFAINNVIRSVIFLYKFIILKLLFINNRWVS